MARTSMASLVARLRTLIHDTANQFTDDDLQNLLDRRRSEHRWALLDNRPTFAPTVLFLDYYSGYTDWEDDYLLQDSAYTDVTTAPDVNEPIVGHWHFPTQPVGIAVRITGKTYDIYGAAADALDAWSAAVALDFSVTIGSDNYQRSQKFDMLTKLANYYRSLAQPQSSSLVQGDANAPYDSGPGVTYPATGTHG